MWTDNHRLRGCTVHPRRCGEHEVEGNKIPEKYGSSPQVRGTSPRSEVTYDTQRFIPAGAGNILPVMVKLTNPSVHPRRCGEHFDSRIPVMAMAGSSPQVRGTFQTVNLVDDRYRFIPAGAGNMG